MDENYNRRLNIRVVGLAEDTEAGQPLEFFETRVPRRPKDDRKGRPHKVGKSPSHPGTKTGPEQEAQVAAAAIPRAQRQAQGYGSGAPGRQDGGLIYNGSRVSLYSDFSATVMKKRKACDEVKQRLREQRKCAP